MIDHAKKWRIASGDQDSQALEMRRELARKIARTLQRQELTQPSYGTSLSIDGLRRVLAIPLRTSRASPYSFKDENV
jgi:hypothetical protein